MKESDKRKSNIIRKLYIIYIYSNNGRHHVTKNSTSLHFTIATNWMMTDSDESYSYPQKPLI
jgi:hypothetical protein